MPDVLIRNIPAEDLERLDEQARRYGLSRADFLRRQLHQQAHRSADSVTVSDLNAMSDLLSDLEDPTVMDQAWS
ncbi:ribbon-helix-helix protein, CopG family [Tessaracoccus sp. ZS01]|uniref:type II toxin-antitoxin system VapB family antitoxin n=1 Tax=Tessaracoccus sp. ZS01 TaxID=1906324 RepID=UPI00096CA972|nr:ribbon-helix-helix protein, CopG family [Tessaracoccus sp. ZS01]MCG6567704.1 ribbon-helix-helix protein, CopG family [Tessaracoccus sp. ZS01]OMG55777.1 antitoxin [Tessaracoccus sp. ZS01]